MPENEFEQFLGRPVRGRDNVQIGAVAAVYVEQDSGAPALVAVRIDGRNVGVPADNASWDAEFIALPFDAKIVRTAPELEEDAVSTEALEEIQTHFAGGLPSDGETDADSDTGPDSGTHTETETHSEAETHPEAETHTETETLTRSEEELRVGTMQVERGRVRVRKYVVQENVTRTIPVTREELRIERESVGATDADDADEAGGADFGEDVQEIVLHEEVPVMQKVRVPKERVRISTDTVTEQRQVQETLQKERIVGPEEVEPPTVP